MAISFNNIPANTRTPDAYTEIDNSRALQGLVANPHTALIIGQRKITLILFGLARCLISQSSAAWMI